MNIQEIVKMNLSFTLIMYRSSYTDFVRGCEMSRTDSDFEMESYDDVESLILKIAKYIEQNEVIHKVSYEWAESEIKLLIEKHCFGLENKNVIFEHFIPSNNNETTRLIEIATTINEEARRIAFEKIEADKLKKQKEKEDKEAKLKEIKEQEELENFFALKNQLEKKGKI